MEPKNIFITGITGQDGSYMAEYCLNLGHIVYGMVRRTAQIHDENYRHLLNNPNLKIVRGDLLDGGSLDSLVQKIKPDYFINFAAQSFVGDSWQIPEETFMVGAVGVLKCLEAIRKYHPTCRFYNAGSSEQFGNVLYCPQDEKHPFRPRSPYGAAKCAAHHLVKVYRESYGLYAVQGLLLNHESEKRGPEFVTRKITQGFARIVQAIKKNQHFEPIKLGNIDAKRDWSHAKDFVDAVWRMLNQDVYNTLLKDLTGQALVSELKEYVVASGECHTVREFVNVIIEHLHHDCRWVGKGKDEVLILNPEFIKRFNIHSAELVSIDPLFYRPAEVDILLGDSSAIRRELGWFPKISFDNLIKCMLESDLNESGIISISAD